MNSVSEISAALRANADSLARELLPGGRYEEGGREWRCGAKNSPTGGAISVHVARDAKQGVCGFWNESRSGGDVLDLVGMVNGLSMAGAMRWAKSWLNIDDADDEFLMTRRNPKIRKRPERDRISDEGRILAAKRIWDNADHIGGPGSTYLAARGLQPTQLAHCPVDSELRFARSLDHPSGGVFPALIARVLNCAGEFTGVWRIYLKMDGSGKAPVDNPRLGLGPVRGAAVRLGGLWPTIGVAEGVETALACRQIVGNSIPVWALLSTSGIRGFAPPAVIESVRIYADADCIKFRDDGKVIPSPGLEAARELTKKLCAAGINVRIEPPPLGMDWLDVLNLNGEQNAM